MICNRPKLRILTVLVLIIYLMPFVFYGCTSPTSMVTDSNAAPKSKFAVLPELTVTVGDKKIANFYKDI